jgi:hypothetical protein
MEKNTVSELGRMGLFGFIGCYGQIKIAWSGK